jgi:hypothetical protein
MGKTPPKEIKNDDRFIAYEDGTVLDTITDLMWAVKDNGYDINWPEAESYCKNYRGGGYTDWRLPTQDELAGLYDVSKSHVMKGRKNVYLNMTDLIDLSGHHIWASERHGNEAAYFIFYSGKRDSRPLSGYTIVCRTLPVRSAK